MLLNCYNKKTKTLNIPYKFNEELKDIPKKTEIIIFQKNAWFNKKVDHLPQYITHITFGEEFNQKVDILPQNIVYIKFGYYFNKSINFLPKNITNLIFDYEFNKKVVSFPKNITHLTFGNNFNQKIDKLPKNINSITFGYRYIQSIDKFPKSIKEISLYCWNNLINYIPLTVKILHIKFCDNISNYNKKIENLSPTINEIIIDDEKYKRYFTKIPFGTKFTVKNFNKYLL